MTFPANIDLSSLDGTDGFSFTPVGASPWSSTSVDVSSAGDVNGDGFADILIGAAYGGPYGYGYQGASYVVFGKASGFDDTVDLSTLGGTAGFRMSGNFANGLSVASAGDVNGDGFADVAVTAVSGINQNVNYVVFGKATGFAANLDLTALGAGEGFKVVGTNASTYGGEVESAGDVNGDGFDDLFIKSEGANYVVFGAATGLGTSVNVATLNGTNGFLISGVGSSFYSHIGSAGDFNGDGFADVIFSSDGDSGDGAGGWGDAYVVFGKASGFGPDINVSTLNGSNGFRMEGYWSSLDSTYNTGSSVSSAGDVNGDGFDDMIVGAKSAVGFGANSKAYIVFGKASSDATFELSALDGTNGFVLVGQSHGDLTGYSVAAAGDVNGDGFADLIVGAPGVNASYVVYGKASGFAASISVTDLDGTNGFKLSGDPALGGGKSVASAGDINGDGAPDLIIGSQSGTTHVVFGIPAEDTTVTTVGSSRVDVLYGGMLEDNLIGKAGNDRLYGLGGDDVLSGGDGTDVLAGGEGDDTMAGGAGIDTAYFAAAQAGVTASLATGMATGTSTGTDVMSGIENLTGSSFDDVLTGNTGANVLSGAAGNDALNGGGDADSMVGGTGNDTYYVNFAGDVVTEGAGAGTDTVRSTITYTLGSDLENLLLTGNAAIDGTGNELANKLTGNSAANVLSGGDGDDTYVVGAGDTVVENADEGTDTVQSSISVTLGANVENLLLSGSAVIDGTGNDLANVLTGNSAANVLSGGDGNDTYVIGTGDTAVENFDEGIDTMMSSASYTLAADIENLTLTAKALNGTGNALANVLTGNRGANALSGGDGNDRLLGGLGADTLTGGNDADAFVFSWPSNAPDTVTDFAQGVDLLEFSAASFGAGLVAGTPPTVLNEAAAATASNPGTDGYFIFDNAGPALATLYWDATGGSGADAVAIAHLTGITSLAASDFQIV